MNPYQFYFILKMHIIITGTGGATAFTTPSVLNGKILKYLIL